MTQTNQLLPVPLLHPERWVLWDERMDVMASVAVYSSEVQALRQINYYLIRQLNGGRPDVDARHLQPRRWGSQ